MKTIPQYLDSLVEDIANLPPLQKGERAVIKIDPGVLRDLRTYKDRNGFYIWTFSGHGGEEYPSLLGFPYETVPMMCEVQIVKQ